MSVVSKAVPIKNCLVQKPHVIFKFLLVCSIILNYFTKWWIMSMIIAAIAAITFHPFLPITNWSNIINIITEKCWSIWLWLHKSPELQGRSFFTIIFLLWHCHIFPTVSTMAHTRENLLGKTSYAKHHNAQKQKQQGWQNAATNTNVQPTHDIDASSISSNSLQNTNTLSNVSPDTLVQNTDTQMLKIISVALKLVKKQIWEWLTYWGTVSNQNG